MTTLSTQNTMKKITSFILTIFLILNGNAQSSKSKYNPLTAEQKIAVQKITDCNCVVGSLQEPLSAEDEIMLGYLIEFEKLDFKTLDSLYKNESNAIKVYSFCFICQKFEDKLSKNHLKILSSAETVNIYKGNSMPVSEIAQRAYDRSLQPSAEEDANLENELIKRVTEFITTYSKYPESYKSQRFFGFQFYSSNGSESWDELSNYVIGHTYLIKNKEGKLIEKTGLFKLTTQSNFMIADDDFIEFLNGDDAIVEGWLMEFGRELTNADKRKLGIQ